jgi:hypothetical protein
MPRFLSHRALRRMLVFAGALSLTACLGAARPRGGVVYVSARPPRGLVEVVAAAPSRAHVWVPGFYAWRGNAYAWVPGRYELPPRGLRRWEPARWRHDRRGWFFVDGRWR